MTDWCSHMQIISTVQIIKKLDSDKKKVKFCLLIKLKTLFCLSTSKYFVTAF